MSESPGGRPSGRRLPAECDGVRSPDHAVRLLAGAGEPPISRWELEVGQRRAERLAALAVRLGRTVATSAELSRAMLPALRALSDRQCVLLERQLDVALADLREE